MQKRPDRYRRYGGAVWFQILRSSDCSSVPRVDCPRVYNGVTGELQGWSGELAIVRARHVCSTVACSVTQAFSRKSTRRADVSHGSRGNRDVVIDGEHIDGCEATIYLPRNVTLPPTYISLLGSARIETRGAARGLKFAALTVLGDTGRKNLETGLQFGVRLQFMTIAPGALNISLNGGFFEGQALSLAPATPSCVDLLNISPKQNEVRVCVFVCACVCVRVCVCVFVHVRWALSYLPIR